MTNTTHVTENSNFESENEVATIATDSQITATHENVVDVEIPEASESTTSDVTETHEAVPLDVDVESETEVAVTATESKSDAYAVLPTEQIDILNAGFIAEIFRDVSDGAAVAVCSKAGNPGDSSWYAQKYDDSVSLPDCNNNYVNCSTFNMAANPFNVRKENFAGYHVLLLDDLGSSKASFDQLRDFQLSWLIETSPGNFQGGIILDKPINQTEFEMLHPRIVISGLCDPGANGVSRWMRLPNAINGKSSHIDEDGNAFVCKLVIWNPEARYTAEEVIEGLKLEELPEAVVARHYENDVFTAKAAVNPVIRALKDRGLYKSPLGSGKHDVTCPWCHEHTDQIDSGAAYFEPDETYPRGGFCCQHSHDYHTNDFLKFLEIDDTKARNKPAIHIVEGELHSIVDAMEKALADSSKYYQMGGLIVCVHTDTDGNPSIQAVKQPALTRELSYLLSFEKYDGRTKDWRRCDPPQRHVSILFDAQNFKHLPELKGIARQPYFCESTGELVTEAGYDEDSKLFGVFDSRKYIVPIEPTREDALAALAMIDNLIQGFHFALPVDRSAAISAIFTATVRPTLDFAPAYHAKASTYGVGKSYLSTTISLFANAAGSHKVSYPATSEEATKVIMSLLLTNPAVIEFDDLDNDLLPHGAIKRALTSDSITDRILGFSKTATVSTRTLFLSSGNNVDPVRDLCRRIVTINLDARCATPATLTYKSDPVELLRANRERYVSAVFTIIAAYRAAGCPKTDVKSIATYNGAWSDYCRHPLIWLGLDDPATSLLEQISQDPDAVKLGILMREWFKVFGSKATTVRKVISAVSIDSVNLDLLDAICEFPVQEHGKFNNTKFGWMLKKNVNRIVDGYEFQKTEADGRVAWCVVSVANQAEPKFEDIVSL